MVESGALECGTLERLRSFIASAIATASSAVSCATRRSATATASSGVLAHSRAYESLTLNTSSFSGTIKPASTACP